MKNGFYKSVLELLFTPIDPWTPLIFLKNIKIAVPYYPPFSCSNEFYSIAVIEGSMLGSPYRDNSDLERQSLSFLPGKGTAPRHPPSWVWWWGHCCWSHPPRLSGCSQAPPCSQQYTVKKKRKENFPHIYKEIQMGAVAKSYTASSYYMTKYPLRPSGCYQAPPCSQYTVKKENKIFSYIGKFRWERLQSHI